MVSGTYQINGVDLPLAPSSGRWVSRDVQGFSGDGHPEYAGVREFEMRWELISADDAATLQGYFDAVSVTGTAVVTIPKYRQPWQFQSYSGCTLSEPTSDDYFQYHETNVTLLVHKIVT